MRWQITLLFGLFFLVLAFSSQAATCGNNICESGENPIMCGIDCCRSSQGTGGGCGDDFCIGYGCLENPTTCPFDCGTPCGNGICDRSENPEICPMDCKNRACGNRICEDQDGGPQGCPIDCGAVCGDGICFEDEVCAYDCSDICGDDVCGFNENCPQDCSAQCGDGICEFPESIDTCADCKKSINSCGNLICDSTETVDTCPADCLDSCGDGVCSFFESILSCKADCVDVCSDGLCDERDLKDGCSIDCGMVSGDGLCTGAENNINSEDCPEPVIEYATYQFIDVCGNGICEVEENQINCYQDCTGNCGDGICAIDEKPSLCSADCGVTCGDNICNEDESQQSCPKDCSTSCGDNQCEFGETPYTCASDCAPTCGNNICDKGEGYTLKNGEYIAFCEQDCTNSYCGDGVCRSLETNENCALDCASVCGDNICEKGEICAWDCPVCGDAVCSPNEACDIDCNSACSNDICEEDESSVTCPYDCTSLVVGELKIAEKEKDSEPPKDQPKDSDKNKGGGSKDTTKKNISNENVLLNETLCLQNLSLQPCVNGFKTYLCQAGTLSKEFHKECASCDNNRFDHNELNVDCGGVCSPCIEEDVYSNSPYLLAIPIFLSLGGILYWLRRNKKA